MILDFLKSGYKKLKNTLINTGSLLSNRIRNLFQGSINADAIEQLEQLFYESDFGMQTTAELMAKVREIYRQNPKLEVEQLVAAIRQELLTMLSQHSPKLAEVSPAEGPMVILVLGVNGTGKTTSVAKLANYLQNQNKKILIGAADTFRAAAIEQLEIWSKRIGSDLVKGNPKSDPAAVAFDAVTAGKARRADVVIIDTAGRLHTKTNLMQELEKIRRSCKKINSNCPHETLLVLDATTGQNAIEQAKTFHQYTPVTGLILTKLDGSAKGGMAISIYRQLGIPIKFIGIGEGLEDLEAFHPQNFVNALFD